MKCVSCLTQVYLHVGGCVSSCPAGYTANANNHCICS